ncbi:MAG: LamG domain-containing protein [Campylobacterales bacterium]
MKKLFFVVLLFLAVATQGWAVPAPIADYHMDECSWNGSSGEVVDSSQKGHNGTIEGAPYTESNQTAGGMLCKTGYFNNANSDSQAISIPDSDDLSPHVGPNGEMTVSAWIKTDRYPKSVLQGRTPIVAKGDNNNWEYALYLYNSGKVGFSVWQKTGSSYAEPAGSSLSKNEWHHVVGVIKKGQYVRVYLDGRMVAESTSFNGVTTNGTSPLYIARRGTGNHYFHGYIDEVKIFNKALNADQINDIYNNEKDLKNYDGAARTCNNCETGYQANFNFDAWESNLSRLNPKLYTKIVKNPLTITVGTKDGRVFNGSVCAAVITQSGQVLGGGDYQCKDINATSTSFSWTLTKASKNVKVTIKSKYGVHEGNQILGDVFTRTGYQENNSTDSFAVRPDHFRIRQLTSAKAGEVSQLVVEALDASNSLVSGYDQLASNITKTVQKLMPSGEVNTSLAGNPAFSLSNFSINDGNASATLSYDDVGMIRVDLNDSNWAAVDSSDGTSAQERTITTSPETRLFFAPYDFNITAENRNFSNNFTYYSDLLERGAQLAITVTARNKQGNRVANYSDGLWEQAITLTPQFPALHNLSARYDLINNWDANFTNGRAELTMRYTYPRESNTSATLPGVVNEADINLTVVDTNATTGTTHGVNGTTTFLYGRLNPIPASSSSTSTPIIATARTYVEVYDPQNVTGWPASLTTTGWRITTSETNGSLATVDHYSPANGISNITIRLVQGGIFEVNASSSVTQKATLHFGLIGDYQRLLWYHPYAKNYSTSGDDCTTHPCAEIEFIKLEAPTSEDARWIGSDKKTIKKLPTGSRKKRMEW